jgi:hypothetical protein
MVGQAGAFFKLLPTLEIRDDVVSDARNAIGHAMLSHQNGNIVRTQTKHIFGRIHFYYHLIKRIFLIFSCRQPL